MYMSTNNIDIWIWVYCNLMSLKYYLMNITVKFMINIDFNTLTLMYQMKIYYNFKSNFFLYNTIFHKIFYKYYN